ncbi:tripartite tricarboxylate transporter substrate binding protein [Corticibacterium sp. UT-5YL-CI-8]|nr:tripartite tricarboxylate transporter substrate binding protein [Tianweitania sp. UT-5YL-CI-8]
MTGSEFTRRGFMASTAGGLLLAAGTRPSFAQEYPSQTIRMILGFAPGGGTDVFARLLAPHLSNILGQQAIVENKPGANGNLATQYVANAKSDGYTLLISTSSSMAASPHAFADMPVDTIKDLEHITMCTESNFCIAVNASLPVNTFEEFVALAKAEPGKLVHAAPGIGGVNHIGGELMALRTGIQLTTAQYKGHGPIIADMLANQVHMTVISVGLAEPYIKAGQLKPLLVMAKKRVPQMPDVPTSVELGIKDLEQITFWIGLHAPKGTPVEILDRVRAAVVKAYESQDLKDRMKASGLVAVADSQEHFIARLKSDYALYGDIIKTAGIKAE